MVIKSLSMYGEGGRLGRREKTVGVDHVNSEEDYVDGEVVGYVEERGGVEE